MTLGLLISALPVMSRSILIFKLIERFPTIVYLGADAIARKAGDMLASEGLVSDWFKALSGPAYARQAVSVINMCRGG